MTHGGDLMPDVAMIRRQVDARIAELEALIAPLQTEYEQLKIVAASIGVAEPRVARAATPRRARRKPAGKGRAAPEPPKSGGGDANRALAAIELIRRQPGITAAELAKAIGTSRNYLYRVLPKLERSGAIVKTGTGYDLAPAPAADS